jgi:hypothetical protein
MARKKPTLHEIAGAALLELQTLRGQPLDRELMKTMTAKAIVGMFHIDHEVYVAWGGSNHPTNLTPLLRAEHVEKTRKKDIKNIAKVRRANKKADAQAQQMVDALVDANPLIGEIFKSRWPSRPMAHGKKSATKRKLNGKIETR